MLANILIIQLHCSALLASSAMNPNSEIEQPGYCFDNHRHARLPTTTILSKVA